MENLSVSKIEQNYIYAIKLCGIYGIIFAFCLYKNLNGITFPVYAAATIFISVLFLKKIGTAVQKSFSLYAFGIILLGISTVMTSNIFFHFFNWVGIQLLFMTAMMRQLDKGQSWDFGKYLKNIFMLCFRTIGSVFTPITHGIKYRKEAESKKENKVIKSILIGVLIAALFLVVVLPLLVYSDKIFAQYFGRIVEAFKFYTEFKILLTVLFGAVMLYSFFTALLKMELTDAQHKKEMNINPVTGITFSGILTVIYVFYSVIQILFLFLRLDSGLPQGVTYSEYAHSGFWQLLGVSLINFVTVLVCKSIFKENKTLKILLLIISICTCIMAFSAFYRMILYVNVYHLTFLRILVLWFLGMLLIIMLGVMWSIFHIKFALFKYITVVVSSAYIILSFANVDKIIVEYNVSHWEHIAPEDMVYLTYGVSLDAAPAIAKIDFDKNGDVSYGSFTIDDYFSNIRDMENSGRNWNYSVAAAKKAADQYFNQKVQ
ncbi:MAG: DUF4173 domain-containing protein [Muricomes sp.]